MSQAAQLWPWARRRGEGRGAATTPRWETPISLATMGMLANLSTLAVVVCAMSLVAAQDCLTGNHLDAQEGQGIGACEHYIAQAILPCEPDAFYGGQYAGV